MKNKIILLALLITPLLILLFSTLSFQSGVGPVETKNNGVFFKEYFDVTQMQVITEGESLSFDDGKWVFAAYDLNDPELDQAMYLMRQLNVALNRDIYRLKRVVFTKSLEGSSRLTTDYPRADLMLDTKDLLFKALESNGEDFFKEQKIFIIDPYGRAVMFFPVSMDPKLILKDLKMLR